MVLNRSTMRTVMLPPKCYEMRARACLPGNKRCCGSMAMPRHAAVCLVEENVTRHGAPTFFSMRMATMRMLPTLVGRRARSTPRRRTYGKAARGKGKARIRCRSAKNETVGMWWWGRRKGQGVFRVINHAMLRSATSSAARRSHRHHLHPSSETPPQNQQRHTQHKARQKSNQRHFYHVNTHVSREEREVPSVPNHVHTHRRMRMTEKPKMFTD